MDQAELEVYILHGEFDIIEITERDGREIRTERRLNVSPEVRRWISRIAANSGVCLNEVRREVLRRQHWQAEIDGNTDVIKYSSMRRVKTTTDFRCSEDDGGDFNMKKPEVESSVDFDSSGMTIPDYEYSSGEGTFAITTLDTGCSSDVNSCDICLNEFELNDDVRKLRCKHFFHLSCVDRWLEERRHCPMCRSNIGISEYEDSNVPDLCMQGTIDEDGWSLITQILAG